jgi:hypothetical protein
MGNSGSSSNETLERFEHARDEVLAVLARGRELADLLGPLQARLEEHFNQSLQAVDSSRLNLVVIGAEGAGKSTLINGIMGADVTPREEQYPGTVAPVYVEAGPNREPEFFVSHEGGEEERVGGDEFARQLLQRHNRDNAKRVIYGVVRYDHPVLAKGLRLVDMPGVEGVSKSVAKDASAFIKDHSHSVVGVFKERNYGTLLRVSDTLGQGRRLPYAVIVSNWPMDPWMLHQDHLKDWIDDQRKILAELLSQQGNVEFADDALFVLHAPSLITADHGGLRVDATAHQAEAAGFQEKLWDYVRRHGVDELIGDAVGEAEITLSELRSLLNARRAVIEEVRSGGEGTASEIQEKFEEARKRAIDRWSDVSSESVIDAVSEEHWAPFKNLMDTHRDSVIAKIRELDQRLEVTEGRISKGDAEEYRDELGEFVAEREAEWEAAHQKTVDEVADYYLAFAQSSLDDFFEEMPLLQTNVGSEFSITREGLTKFEISKLDDDIKSKVLRGGTAAAAAWAGGAAAGGTAAGGVGASAALVGVAGLGPVGALLVGAVGAGALVYLTVGWVQGSRAAIQKSLKTARTKAQSLDTSAGGDLHKSWMETFGGIAGSVEGFLFEQLDSLERAIRDPGSNREELEAEEGRLDQAIGEIGGPLRDRLNTIYTEPLSA